MVRARLRPRAARGRPSHLQRGGEPRGGRLGPARASRPVTILVVDDASPDGTGRLAEELARGRSDLRVLRREGPRGFGEAQTEGLRAALASGASAIVTMDCDFSHDPQAVPGLLGALEEADLVIGSRYVQGGRLVGWPAHRRALSAAANAFVRDALPPLRPRLHVRFRAYRPEVLRAIPWGRLHSPGYSFLVEVLVLGLAASRDAGPRGADRVHRAAPRPEQDGPARDRPRGREPPSPARPALALLDPAC